MLLLIYVLLLEGSSTLAAELNDWPQSDWSLKELGNNQGVEA
jgi:hypothetical protein